MVAPVRILVVDDEVQIAQLLTGVLRGEGHVAEYETDGEAALSRLQRESFDLIVTDLRMPRMDGMRLIEAAKGLHPELEALLMTAYASTDSAVGALRQGVTDYLRKPFGVDEVKSAVDKALAARARRQEEAAAKATLTSEVASTREDLDRRVADLSFLHDLTRLIADRQTPLDACLTLLRDHLRADLVLYTRDGKDVVARIGDGAAAEPGLLDLAQRTCRGGLAHLGRDAMAAPVADGAVVVGRGGEFGGEELRLLSIAGRDLALAVENDRLRANQRQSYLGIVATLIEAVEAKDRFNRGHSKRVADLAARFARVLGLSGRDAEVLETAAKLHDIGKIGIPEEILNKRGRLTDEEFDVIKTHPVLGEQILLPLEFLAEARPIVRHHHERWDGGGYPDGLAADRIPPAAAMLAIVDSYDAMTSTRPYRDGLPRRKALDILHGGAGTQWDPDLVSRFETVSP